MKHILFSLIIGITSLSLFILLSTLIIYSIIFYPHVIVIIMFLIISFGVGNFYLTNINEL